MLMKAVTGNAALARPCARGRVCPMSEVSVLGISASLHVIDVRLFNSKEGQAPEQSEKTPEAS